jgi:hypothetical protein
MQRKSLYEVTVTSRSYRRFRKVMFCFFLSGILSYGEVNRRLHTTDECRPGTYAYLTATEIDKPKDVEGQRTPEWFVLRMFSVTGTVANVLWKAAAKLDTVHVSVAKTLDLLSIQHGASIYGRSTGTFCCICYCCVANQWSHNERLTMSQFNCFIVPPIAAAAAEATPSQSVPTAIQFFTPSPQQHLAHTTMVGTEPTPIVRNTSNNEAPSRSEHSWEEMVAVAPFDDGGGKPPAIPTPHFPRQPQSSIAAAAAAEATPSQSVPTTIQFFTPSTQQHLAHTTVVDTEPTPIVRNTSNNAAPFHSEHSWDEMVAAATQVSATQETFIARQGPPEDEQRQNIPLYTQEFLDRLTIPELKEILVLHKLKKGGKKPELVNRLLLLTVPEEGTNPLEPLFDDNSSLAPSVATQASSRGTQSDIGMDGVLVSLLKAWFMPPLKDKDKSATRIGSLNESNIIRALPRFVQKHRTDISILHIKEYGLLANRAESNLVVSPDGLVIARIEQSGSFSISLLEMKTKVKNNQEQKEVDLLNTLGPYCDVVLRDGEGGVDFKVAIPEEDHRSQLLHGMAVMNLTSAFYVVASTAGIIRVVYIQFHEDDVRNYRNAIQILFEEANLKWIDDDGVLPQIDPTEFTSGKLVHAVDRYSICKALDLWRVLRKKIIDEGKPFPKGRRIVPVVVALWNRCKGPIDLYSRFLRNVQAKHKKLAPIGAVWLRLIMTIVYNAYQTYSLSVSLEYLMSNDCKSFLDFQRFRNRKSESFGDFCFGLACHICKIDREAFPAVYSVGAINAQRLVTYNAREKFFEGFPYYNIRMDPALAHFPVAIDTSVKEDNTGDESQDNSVESRSFPRRRCVVCCRNNHEPGLGPPCSRRLGLKTSMECYTCKVSLCIAKRYDQKSCFEIWHTMGILPDVCQPASVTGLKVRRRRLSHATTDAENNPDEERLNHPDEERLPSTPLLHVPPQPIREIRSRRGSASFEIPVTPVPMERRSRRLSDGNKANNKRRRSASATEQNKPSAAAQSAPSSRKRARSGNLL